MANTSDTRDAARKRAQNHFTASEQRDTAIKLEIERDRAAVEAKTAKLRALRLAKEAEDAKAAEAEAAKAPPASAAKSKKAAKPKAIKARKIAV